MSTSSATRLLSSTWVALTTMQRKWRDHHLSISQLQGPRNKPTSETKRKTAWNNVDIEQFFFFPGVRLKDEFLHQQGQKKKSNNKNSNKKSVSNSNHTHQEFPWGAGGCGDCPCVIHILTSVFQCEGRIIHVCCGQLSPIWNQWNTNGFWTGIMILYVYKKKQQKGKKTKKHKHKEPGYLLHP